MWGPSATDSALRAAAAFREKGYKEVLIPGIGYGRNAQPFLAAGMAVTGIEISATALASLKETFGSKISTFHGSVTDMPFEQKLYDGIFSFALIHLLNEHERHKFIAACFAQLKAGGTMVIVSIADTAPMFGTGVKIAERLYETMPGVRLFFYDEASIRREFGAYGLANFQPISEPTGLDFLWIECRKDT